MAETALPKRDDVAQDDFFVLFANRIEPDLNSGCLLWARSRSKAGYGTLTWKGHTRLTHRCAYEAQHGIGAAHGLVIRHKCDTPACVNPAHLVGGTVKQNCADMWSRGRGNPARGEHHAKAILTKADVLEARRLAAIGNTVGQLRKVYGVRHNTMESAVKGWSWKHLPGAVPHPRRADR